MWLSGEILKFSKVLRLAIAMKDFTAIGLISLICMGTDLLLHAKTRGNRPLCKEKDLQETKGAYLIWFKGHDPELYLQSKTTGRNSYSPLCD